jgi:hypothetical protein
LSAHVKKHLTVGPGGRRCICCFPAPGSRDRKLEYRSAKRRAAREAMQVENDNS